MRAAWIVACLLPLSVVAQTPAGAGAPAAAPPAKTTAAAGALASVYAQFDALFKKRDAPGAIAQMHQLLAGPLKAHPNDFGLTWRDAALVQWQADGETNADKKSAMGKQCWHEADVAAKVQPKRVEGWYYGAACVGAYSEGIGILTALTHGIQGEFTSRLNKAIQLDSKFQSCAPLVAMGRYYDELPWPKRDRDQSEKYFKKAISLCPENLRAYLWLAETQADNDHASQALKNLQHVAKGSIAYDPPEGRRVKKWEPQAMTKVVKEIQ